MPQTIHDTAKKIADALDHIDEEEAARAIRMAFISRGWDDPLPTGAAMTDLVRNERRDGGDE